MAEIARQGHLEYYRAHQIAPVSYDLSDISLHLQRREALYNKVGLPPLAFRNNDVLEVAAGTGHNSLYIAHLAPRKLVLLEPNPTAIKLLEQAYENFRLPHVTPSVVTSKLEDYSPEEDFDIILCENWLGTSSHEQSLLCKLGTLVRPGGALVVTTVNPIGFVPNVLRRFLCAFLLRSTMTFAEKSEVLCGVFQPHLHTMRSMTRSVKDWVQDNMLNPAYFGICLSVPAVVEQLRSTFDVLGCTPSFAEDWRWFKAMCGTSRQINEHWLNEYWAKAINYFDCRAPIVDGDPAQAQKLERLAYELLDAVEANERTWLQTGALAKESVTRVLALASQFADCLPSTDGRSGIEELLALFGGGSVPSAEQVTGMSAFGPLFGRETGYISLVKRSGWSVGVPV